MPNGYTSRRDWFKAYVKRLVTEQLADCALSNDDTVRAAALRMNYHGLQTKVSYAVGEYANLRELEDIIDFKDRRKP